VVEEAQGIHEQRRQRRERSDRRER
jgi:hypothetical protein